MEVISANGYILCGFDFTAQIYSVFFLEESKFEQIRKNMLVSWHTENVTEKPPYKSITTQNQIDL